MWVEVVVVVGVVAVAVAANGGGDVAGWQGDIVWHQLKIFGIACLSSSANSKMSICRKGLLASFFCSIGLTLPFSFG